MAEQQLHGTEVSRPSVDQRCLRPSHRVRSVVGRIQSEFSDPATKNAGVLPGAEVRRVVHSAREQEVVLSQSGAMDPGLHSLAGSGCELKLHRTLRLVLHHCCPRGNVLSVADVHDLQANKIAASQLAVQAQIEESELAHSALQLQSHPQCPDVLELEMRLLADDLALVPRHLAGCSFY